uniref:CSON000011 protein n=1 Tax=Culicoides sonorensis TaxID=179676 RepID=A0A336KV49_CULSO
METLLGCIKNCCQKLNNNNNNEKIYDFMSNKNLLSSTQSIQSFETFNSNISELKKTTITGLHKEKQRRLTFSDWNCLSTDKLLLAQIGFYFIGSTDLVKCYFCNLEIGMWQPDDDPVKEHLRWSPNCPLLLAFFPCGHIIACVKCASSVTKCPYCSQPFVKVMRVYFS